jgi:hypothetical protein
MDYLLFTKRRLRFVRFFYSEASRHFGEMQRKIEEHVEPFEWPNGYEKVEPPFLNDWVRAGEATFVVGECAASILAETLHLYIKFWVDDLKSWVGVSQLCEAGIGIPSDDQYKKAFKQGWINGYKEYFARHSINWNAAPGDLHLLEELVLARNAAQHPSDVASVRARAANSGTSTSSSRSSFSDKADVALNQSLRPSSIFLQPARIAITAENLEAAVVSVEEFCSWLDAQHPKRQPSAGAS